MNGNGMRQHLMLSRQPLFQHAEFHWEALLLEQPRDQISTLKAFYFFPAEKKNEYENKLYLYYIICPSAVSIQCEHFLNFHPIIY